MKKKTIILIISVIALIAINKTFSQAVGSWVIPFNVNFINYEVDRLEFDQNIQPYFLQNITQTNYPYTSGGYDNNGVLLFYIMETEIYDANSNYVGDFFYLPAVQKSSVLPKVQIISKPESEGTYYIIYSVKGQGGNMDNDFFYTEISVDNGQVSVVGRYRMPSTISEPDGGSFVVSPIIDGERKIYRAYISGGITETPITVNGFGTEHVILGINNPVVGANENFISYNLEMKKNNNCQTVFAWFTRYMYADHQSIFVYNYDINDVTKIDVVPNSDGFICGIEFSSYEDDIIYVSYEDYDHGGNNAGIYKINYITGNSTLVQNSGNYAQTFLETATDGNIYGVSNDGNYFCKIDMQTGQFISEFYTNGEVLSYVDNFYHLYTLPENENVNLIGSNMDYTVTTGTVSCECPVTFDGWALVENITGCNISDPNNVTYTWYDNSGNVIQEGGDYIDNLSTGTYSVCVQDNSYPPVIKCKTFTIDLDPDLYTDNDMVNINAAGQIWDNEQRSFKQGIYIHNGAELTINNSYLQFGPNAVVIVEQGAKLIINHSTLKDINACPCNWKGIQVWGNSSLSQYPDPNTGNYQQGYLNMDSTTIMNAVTAVDLWNPGDYTSTGGIIHAKNSKFINCTKSIHALYYKNFNPNDPDHNELPYDAFFKLDTFEITPYYNGSDVFYKHVDLSHVKGIDFKGCYFYRDVSAPNVADYNIGIAAYNAGFNVNDGCASQTDPCPDNDLIRCTFNGFYSGILADGDESNYYVFNIYNAVFENNIYGVKTTYFKNFTIINSDFEIGHNNSPEATENINASGYGIWTDNCTGFAIEENHFSKYGGAPTAYYTGIRIANTNATDEVYKNYFDGLSYADLSQGKNWELDNRYKGLAYYCNQNSNNYADFYVDTKKPSGIQSEQGNLEHAAGNTFSPNSTWDFYNGGEHLVGYYYNENSTDEAPDINKVYHVTPYAVSVVNQCESHYGGDIRGNTVLSSQQRQTTEQTFSDNLADYNSVKTLYDNLKDGGSTSDELSDIENAQPSDMWTLRTQLLGDSPHLSMEVLKKTADRTDVFPDATIFDILAANPDELKKDELIKYLEEKDNPLPQYMIDILKQLANGSTYKTVLQTQMAYYNQVKTRAANDIIRSILNDSIIDYTDLRNWLDNLGGISADRQIIGSYIAQGNFSDAMNLANMLPQLYDLQGADSIEHLFYMDMLALYDTLYVQGRNTEQLDSTELAQLVFIADSSSDVAGAQARSILESVYGYHFTNFPNFNDSTAGYKNSPYAIAGGLADIYGISVSANPNPASQWTAINYVLHNDKSNGAIEITDLSGKTVARLKLSGKQGQKVLDTRKIPSGVYLINLKTEGFVKTVKLVINK